MRAFSKYMYIGKAGLQDNLEYRFNYFTTFIFVIAPLLVHMSMWVAVYGTGIPAEDMMGYSFEKMMTYTILSHLIEKFTGESTLQVNVANEIKEGRISRYLLTPIQHFGYELTIFFSNRVIYFATLIIPYLSVIYFSRTFFHFQSNATFIILFFISLFIGLLIAFMLNHLLGLMVFWLREITSLHVFTQSTFSFLAGGYFTLDFMPKFVLDILMLTPLPYTLFFPVSIYLGNYSMSEISGYLLVSLIWVFILYALNRLLWTQGIKKYSADGI